LGCGRPPACGPTACGTWQQKPRLAGTETQDDRSRGSSQDGRSRGSGDRSFGRCTKVANPESCEPNWIQLEGKVTRTTWQYVGSGRGTHETSRSYDYVGHGRGDFRPVSKNVQQGWRLGRYCIMLLILAFVAVACWGFYLSWLQQVSTRARGGRPVAMTEQAHRDMHARPAPSVKNAGSLLT